MGIGHKMCISVDRAFAMRTNFVVPLAKNDFYMKYLFWIFGLSLVLLSCNSTQKAININAVDFVTSDKLMPVLEMANDKNKLVFVDFYTTWCLPCKMMDEDVFTDKGISEFFNHNFINYKVDAEKGGGPDLALLYQVNVYPTLLFLDETGKVLVRKEGAAYQSELRSLGEQAIATHSESVGD